MNGSFIIEKYTFFSNVKLSYFSQEYLLCFSSEIFKDCHLGKGSHCLSHVEIFHFH